MMIYIHIKNTTPLALLERAIADRRVGLPLALLPQPGELTTTS